MQISRIGHFCKLDRATKHLEEFGGKLTDFLQPDCYEIIDETETKGESTDKSGRAITRSVLRRKVFFKKEPPLLHWGTIVGDIVHNLRSALDHLVFTASYRADPTTFIDDNTTAFPICDSPSEFRGPKRRTWQPFHEIRGLSDDARTIIEGLQPYKRGDAAAMLDDPLRILREMDDIDKHRAIHLTGWSADTIALDITHVPSGTSVHSHSVRPAGAIESGTVLAELDFSSVVGLTAMHMNRQFYFAIAFDEGTPLAGQEVHAALWDLAFYVEGVLNALHRFVPAKVKR